MPPEIVGQFLRSTIDFPAAQHIEVIVIDKENSTWPSPIGCAQRADVNTFRTAVDRMWSGIPSTPKDILRFDSFNDLEVSRIRFRIDNVNARRP